MFYFSTTVSTQPEIGTYFCILHVHCSPVKMLIYQVCQNGGHKLKFLGMIGGVMLCDL